MVAPERRPGHRAGWRIRPHGRVFTAPAYETLNADDPAFTAKLAESPAFARWVARNTLKHKVAGYRAVTPVAEGHRRAAGRRHRRTAGRRG